MRLIKTGCSFVCALTAALATGCLAAEPDPTDPAAADPATGEATSALASDCEAGRNGFIDISDSAVGTLRPRTVDMGFGVTVTLEVANISGAQRGFAKISGATLSTDLVWMDWTTNGGATWLQCGPFQVDANGRTKTSAAKNTSPSPTWQFRACGRLVPQPSLCSDWW